MAALSAGMWLFTFAAPFFYWFGAPTAFIMGYLLLSCESCVSSERVVRCFRPMVLLLYEAGH